MTAALFFIGAFLAILTFQTVFVAGCLRRIADALEAQNRHYGIPVHPATEVPKHG